jgi:hypothetical protein
LVVDRESVECLLQRGQRGGTDVAGGHPPGEFESLELIIRGRGCRLGRGALVGGERDESAAGVENVVKVPGEAGRRSAVTVFELTEIAPMAGDQSGELGKRQSTLRA